LLKGYDLQIQYHPGKTNIIADAPTRRHDISLTL